MSRHIEIIASVQLGFIGDACQVGLFSAKPVEIICVTSLHALMLN